MTDRSLGTTLWILWITPAGPGMTSQNGRPSTEERPPVEPVVPRPGDNGRTTVGADADIARDALRAAREASAEKAAERTAQRSGRKPTGARGRRRRWSGAGPDDRDPQLFGRLVARVSLDRGWSPRLTDATVLGRWPQLVGAEIADHCTPISLRDGELVLQAESTAWATQLRTLQRQLLTRLAAAVGKDVVKRIRVVGPSGPSWRHGPRTVRGRGPATPTAELRSAVSVAERRRAPLDGTAHHRRGARWDDRVRSRVLQTSVRRSPWRESRAERDVTASEPFWTPFSAVRDPSEPAIGVLSATQGCPSRISVGPPRYDGGMFRIVPRGVRSDRLRGGGRAACVKSSSRGEHTFRGGQEERLQRVVHHRSRGSRGGPQAARHVHRLHR